MGIPNEAEGFQQPPAGDDVVEFGGGGHQTWDMDKTLEEGEPYPGKVARYEAIVGTFGGKKKKQFVFLHTIDGREEDGELSYYTGRRITGHPKEKLGPYLRALQVDAPTPENPKMPPVVGRPCRLIVENLPSTTKPGKFRPTIIKVLAAKA